jgi:hypothetical protein
MLKINGLPGIGTAGKIGYNGENGINVYYNNNSSDIDYSNINNSFFIDDNFNMYYNLNGRKNIYESFFYDLDTFKIEKNFLYTTDNLLYQRNIFSKEHQKEICPDVDFKFVLLDDNLSVSSNDSSLLSLSHKDYRLNTTYKDDKIKITTNNSKIYLKSKKGNYHFSKEQKVLNYIKTNVLNLVVVTSDAFYQYDKKYYTIEIFFNKFYEYLKTEFTDDEIKSNIKMEFFTNDNKFDECEELLIKNFNDDIYSSFVYKKELPSNEYDFSYFLKIYIKNANDNIYLHYTYITKIKKDKITETDEKYSDTYNPIINYTPAFENTIRNINKLTNTQEEVFILVDSSTNETHSNDSFIEDNSTNNNNSYSGGGNGYYNYGYDHSYYDDFLLNQGHTDYSSNNLDHNGAKPGTGNEQGLIINNGPKNRLEILRYDAKV